MRNRKLFRTFIVVGMTAACLAFASVLWAENQAPKASGRVQAEGLVTGMAKLTPSDGGKPALRLSIQEDSGDILTVEACERISSKEGGPGFAIGDRVRVIGTMTQRDEVAILESCDILILSALADSGGPRVTYVPTSPTVNTYVGGYDPYAWYPWTYTWYSPVVVCPRPFFRAHVVVGHSSVSSHRRGQFGFRGSNSTQFHRGGTWNRSGGTWTNPGRARIAPRTIAPRTTPRMWRSTSRGHITSTTPITPRIVPAPQRRGSSSVPRMHGSFSGRPMRGAGRNGGRSR